MKINLVKQGFSLYPATDDDADTLKKMKRAEVYHCEIKAARNYNFHKKYFALINTAWEYLNEGQAAYFKTQQNFRKSLEMAAGYYDTIPDLKRGGVIEQAQSIAFDKMDELTFAALYDGVKNVLFSVVLKNITEAEFMANLIDF